MPEAIISPKSECGEQNLEACISALIGMDRSFYDVFDLCSSALFGVMRDIVDDSGSEFSKIQVIINNGLFAGFFCIFPSSELYPRRMVNLRHLMSASENIKTVKEKLSHFEDGVSNNFIPASGLYLTKIYLAENFRGTNLSGVVQKTLRKMCRLENASLYAHVKRDNIQALSFYKKYGYKKLSSDGKYHLMVLHEI